MIWERIAGLPLVVEDYSLERLSSAYERITTLVTLAGAGETGASEDIMNDEAMLEAGTYLSLAGRGRSRASATTSRRSIIGGGRRSSGSWPATSASGPSRRRRWTSRCARRVARCPTCWGVEPRPLRFVNSLGLGDPPSVEKIARRVELNPTVGFKLDAEVSWTPEIVRGLGALDRVRTVDFKGRYGLEVPATDQLVAMYRAVIEVFDEALLEDPHDLPEIDAVLAPVRERVSFDAPITRVADITTRVINVKPSRIGGLRPLFEIYEHCAADGIAMYGGGMGELGIARGQVELLASMFHPDADNDVAPSEFNAPELEAALPSSPLVPPPLSPGFRWG